LGHWIATATSRPEKVLGLHYLNPAVLMRLVEVVRADKTSDEIMKIGIGRSISRLHNARQLILSVVA
jgi:3-hydroxyacyl-CoA dehydrogenase